ncbi:MAG: hypothetical protein V3T23_12670 [Nitrososphaerales archaeon]
MSIEDITQEEYHFMISSMNNSAYKEQERASDNNSRELWVMINSIIDKLDWKKLDEDGASTTPTKQEYQTLQAGKDHEERMLKFEGQLNEILDLVGSNQERIKEIETPFVPYRKPVPCRACGFSET